jgi:transcriptional regulator with XRE-family HTH domain
MGLQPVTALPAAGHLNDIVAEEVRALMARRRMSQAAVAKVLGISQSQLSKRLRSDIVFDLGEVQKLADFFGVGIVDLVSGSTHETPPPAGPGEDVWANNGSVRHQGLEPRTRWLRASLHEYALVA